MRFKRSRLFWAFISLSLVSLFADVTYEGARSIVGAYFRVLGATILVVGLATISDLVGFLFRGLSGFIAGYSRSSRVYWLLIYIGYAINLFAVPLLAFTGYWEEALVLVILERLGKGLRTPARDVVLAEVTEGIGRGKGFGLHEVFDQIGGFLGPSIVAYSMVSYASFHVSFLILFIPALTAMFFLTIAYSLYPRVKAITSAPRGSSRVLPKKFWRFILVVVIASLGFIHWSLVAYYLKDSSVVADAYIPVLYMVAMASDALIAFPIGYLYDRIGVKTLVLAPLILATTTPMLFYSKSTILVFAFTWGLAMGFYETVMRACIADIVEPGSRAYAYGVYGVAFGLSWCIGNIVMSYLYMYSITTIPLYTIVVETIALITALAVVR